MQLLAIVELHVLIDDFGQLVHSLAKLDAFITNCFVDGHHSVLLALVDQLDLLHSLHFLGEELVALFPQVG